MFIFFFLFGTNILFIGIFVKVFLEKDDIFYVSVIHIYIFKIKKEKYKCVNFTEQI